jgi:hypothetical protein
MDRERLLELLAYAKVCFDKCTNPFETIHLIKKKVTADECRDLSFKIAEIIREHLDLFIVSSTSVLEQAIEKAEKEFAETQEELIGRYG